MIDRFATLLEELEKFFELSLAPDSFNACSIQIPPLTIQMEVDESAENLLIFAKIFELPPGKFRENVLREALKANGEKDPRPAVLGYINATNHLAMHQRYPLSVLTGELLYGILGAFLELGESWASALENGNLPLSSSQNPLPPGIRP